MVALAPNLPARRGIQLVGALAGRVAGNLFSSPLNVALTLVMLGVFWFTLVPLVEWTILKATLFGTTKSDCFEGGACWVFVKQRLPSFFYGRYPAAERWRVDLAAVLLIAFAVPAMMDRLRRRWLAVLLLVGVFPWIAGVLLHGGMLGLAVVDTGLWGGLMLNVVLSFLAVSGSMPLGIILALGRRSEFPVFRLLAVAFIELWRGVPLLTALFMGTVMLPLFMPDGVTVDNVVRAAVALTLFTSAYMAEVVRGGLQAVPLGQVEAAKSLGFGYWTVQGLVVLPQALRLVVPNIVNTVIDLFKDTTLVVIVSLFDLLGVVNQAIKDSAWLGMVKEGYAFALFLFFVCCFAMSLYSRRLERRLGARPVGGQAKR
jgi:general L-amino acid transport system permease protein